MQLVEKKAITFHGKPCKTCQATERYISSGNCIACQRRMQKESRIREAARMALEAEIRRKTKGKPIAIKTVSKPHHESAIGVAISELGKRGHIEHGRYFVDGEKVTLVQFLQAANKVIEQHNATASRDDRKPLIGNNHQRWSQ